MTAIFKDHLVNYYQAGWRCIMPVPPHDKHPPPRGFTGEAGADTTPEQLVEWSEPCADYSIALRMPDGVIGIDVDHYDKGDVCKRGNDTLHGKEAEWGQLPATWTCTARGTDDGPGASRTLFYRVPTGRYRTKLGPDIEIIQRHHRYAVVAPSLHPLTATCYRWYDPDDVPLNEGCPSPDELTALPDTWITGLREGATEAGPQAADESSGRALLDSLLADDRPTCHEITDLANKAQAVLSEADTGSRHDLTAERVHALVLKAAHGHPGLAAALQATRDRFDELTAGEDRGGEFDSFVLGSARKAVTELGTARPVRIDPCLMADSLAALPAPGGTGDRGDAPEPVYVPWNLREITGVTAFDPIVDNDQQLAQAVLARMRPALRYADDAGSWLVRSTPVCWEQARGDLAPWAVAHLAGVMPKGDPDADLNSMELRRYKRRQRFLDHGGSGKVAGKMRAIVAAGTDPAITRLSGLDRDPEVLWAGGLPYNLAASAHVPVIAERVDPSSPHLHSAACAPAAIETPLFDAYLAAMWPDVTLRAWALRVLSVALTGYADKVLPILIGETDRGKTQLVVLLMSVLGSYAHGASPKLLSGGDNTHDSIVFDLKGRRLSFIDEGPREGRWAQERLKQLTGGADLTGNRMRENPVTFAPTHTLILTANDAPSLTDPAIRRRARLIPCEGDPETIRAARAAVGATAGPRWQAEAPGVLARMMTEAGAWLADPASAGVLAGPERVWYWAEEIGAEQDPIRLWLDAEMAPDAGGMRAAQLYELFVAYGKRTNVSSGRIPSVTKWGRELSRLGYEPMHREDGNYRGLRVRRWDESQPDTRGTVPDRDNLMGSGGELKAPEHSHGEPLSGNHPSSEGVFSGDLKGLNSSLRSSTTEITTTPYKHDQHGSHAPYESDKPEAPLQPSGLGAKTATHLRKQGFSQPVSAAKPVSTPRSSTERDHDCLTLPVLVTRNGTCRSVASADAAALLDPADELTVDVETTGYPVGHVHFALRTVQLGRAEFALVLDPDDPAQAEIICATLYGARVLHAHSASADLVPLAHAGLCDADAAWAKMADTVLPAKLADPASTGSDPGLKQLAGAVLGDASVIPAANEARVELFKANTWLTDAKPDTDPARVGWAQVERTDPVMARYAASDVLDTALLAERLPDPDPAVLAREQAVQRVTARITHSGVAIDGAHAAALHTEHTAARDDAARRVQGFGVANPASGDQIAAALAERGTALPRTSPTSRYPDGKPSVAEPVLQPLREAPGEAGELAGAVLDYRSHAKALSTYVEPYQAALTYGDGRIRPTIYTLGADTGRMSSARPNVQNVPRSGGYRAMLRADPGHVLISADFKSVEIRVAAALSGDRNLIDMLAAGVDVHAEIARQVFGPDAGKRERYAAKRIVFGRLYGGGVETLATQAGVDQATTARALDVLDAMTPGLTGWSATLRENVKSGAQRHYRTYSGRVIHLPTRTPHAAPNYAVQGTARELLVDGLLAFEVSPFGGGVVWPVHDEVIAMVPEADADAALAALVAGMETELAGVAIVADPSEPSPYWRDAV